MKATNNNTTERVINQKSQVIKIQQQQWYHWATTN